VGAGCGEGASGAGDLTICRSATIFTCHGGAKSVEAAPRLAPQHGYCNNGANAIHLYVEFEVVAAMPPERIGQGVRLQQAGTISMYRAVTRNIEVVVKPRFVADRSAPENNYFFWAYTISITNSSDETVQLKTRHWRITDANGKLQEVRGAGVVGEEPVLKAGESFEYTSGVPLQTPSGFMVGTYGMVSTAGEHFDIDVPAFSLDSVEAKRTLN
jgi:ApaG protein